MRRLIVVAVLVAIASGAVWATGQAESPTATISELPRDVTWLNRFHQHVDNFPAGSDVNSFWLVDEIRELTGFNIEFQSLPKTDPQTKIALILASGSTPDLISMNSRPQYFTYAPQAVFAPLDERIQEYAPTYLSVVKDESLEAPKVDGVTYGLSVETGTHVGQVVDGMGGRVDLIQQLGFDEPESLDDYYELFVAVRDRTGLIPFTAAGNSPGALWSSLGSISGAFGVSNTTIEKNGRLELVWTEPEFLDFLTFAKKMYDEGLLAPEFSLYGSGDRQSQVASLQAALFTMPWWNGPNVAKSLAETAPEAEVGYLPSPVGPEGHAGERARAEIWGFIVVPDAAANPDGAVAFIDNIFTPEYLNLVNYGIEGETFERVDGQSEYLNNERAETLRRVNQFYVLWSNPDFKMLEYEKAGFLSYIEELDEKLVRTTEATHLKPPIEAYDSVVVELESFAYENAIKFIMGARPIDEFDQFVSELENRGARDAVAALNEWYLSR